jgi:ferredoxin
MTFQICIKPNPNQTGLAQVEDSFINIELGQSLLAASERHRHQPIAVGCRGGGCGICRVRVLSGEYDSKVMSKAHISDEQKAEGWVLACRVFPKTDMVVMSDTVAKRKLA